MELQISIQISILIALVGICYYLTRRKLEKIEGKIEELRKEIIRLR